MNVSEGRDDLFFLGIKQTIQQLVNVNDKTLKTVCHISKKG